MDLLARMTTFVRVVQAGSLSAAARQLAISTAAVSRHISELETSVAVTLLARTTRRLAPTAAGRRYYESCQRVLAEVEDAQAIGGDQVDAPVRISVPVTVGVHAGSQLVAQLFADHPELQLELRLDDRVIDLALDDVDIAIRVAASPPMSDQVIAVPLSSWSRVLVASPVFLRRIGAPTTPEDLAPHPALASGSEGRRVTWTLVDGERSADVRMPARLVTNSGHAMRDIAIAGYGIARLPPWFVANDIKRRRLQRVLPDWEATPTAIYALYRPAGRKRRHVKRIVDYLRRAYPEWEAVRRAG